VHVDPARLAGFRRVLGRVWPWASLALGLVSALVMDRRPERGRVVVAAIAASWVLGIGARPFLDWLTPRLGGEDATPVRLARLGSQLAAVGPLQFVLFFTIPFFWRARAAIPAQLAFISVLAVCAVLTLWDPLLRAIASLPVPGSLLLAVGTFAGVDALLPILGASNRRSLQVAVLAMAVLWVLGAAVLAPAGRRLRVVAVVTPAALLLAAAFQLPAVRRAVPAAPLRLVSGGFGTDVKDWALTDPSTELVAPPAQLACLTVISAPRGVRDALLHVWRHDGVERDRIPLLIRGGSPWGFSTWSIKKHLGDAPAGRWTCTVETGSGQVLGELAVRVGEDAAPPPVVIETTVLPGAATVSPAP
jgi:hypothetical protein